MKADIIIGVDPDVDKSGVAELRVADGHLELLSLSFPLLLDYLRGKADCGQSVVVVVEASWKISTNWHTQWSDSARVAARKGKDAGRGHEVGRKICECARHYGLAVVEQRPLKKIWKGKDGKITHEELQAFTHIADARSNQEERDAALLAWNHSGLPIRLARPLK